MSTRREGTPQGREGPGGGTRPNRPWPQDVMVSAASMIVDRNLAAARVAKELRIPYTTVANWAQRYRSGGRAALVGGPGRGELFPYLVDEAVIRRPFSRLVFRLRTECRR